MTPDIVQRLTTYARGGCTSYVRQLCLDAVAEINALRDRCIPSRGTVDLMDTLVDVIIPTRLNPSTLTSMMKVLGSDPRIGQVIIVADGNKAYHAVRNAQYEAVILHVPDRDGIHRMWNLGLELVTPGHHVMLLNDDLTINADTVSGCADTIDRNPRLGLCCPNYSGETITADYRAVHTTCRGRYDGSGGLGGFAMMLRSTVVPSWFFDEKMVWWYGDDDILNHVVITLGMDAGICRDSTCADNNSHTTNTDPPPGFNEIVWSDREVFDRKWGMKK